MSGQTVFYTLTDQETAAYGSGRQSPVPAVVIGHRAGDLLDLDVLLPLLNRPVVVRRDVPAGAVGQPGRWTRTVPPQFLADTPPQAANVGTPYSYRFEAKGSPAPTFAVASGALPAGLALSAATGVLAGTPTTAGSATFTVAATNGSAPDAMTDPVTVVVGP